MQICNLPEKIPRVNPSTMAITKNKRNGVATNKFAFLNGFNRIGNEFWQIAVALAACAGAHATQFGYGYCLALSTVPSKSNGALIVIDSEAG